MEVGVSDRTPLVRSLDGTQSIRPACIVHGLGRRSVLGDALMPELIIRILADALVTELEAELMWPYSSFDSLLKLGEADNKYWRLCEKGYCLHVEH